MTYDLDEQEQLEAIKAWWQRYGNAVLTVLIVILLAIAGWQGWNWYQNDQARKAGGYFEALQSAVRQGNLEQVRDASTQLRNRYGSTAYAPRGALLAAQLMLKQGDVAGAREQFEWVKQHGGPTLAPVARLRLAGLLLDQKEYDNALAQLGPDIPAGFAALYADRRGDILFAQGKLAEARRAWEEALRELGQGDALVSIVRLKLEALGEQGEKA